MEGGLRIGLETSPEKWICDGVTANQRWCGISKRIHRGSANIRRPIQVHIV